MIPLGDQLDNYLQSGAVMAANAEHHSTGNAQNIEISSPFFSPKPICFPGSATGRAKSRPPQVKAFLQEPHR
jgi:hypothetical protein